MQQLVKAVDDRANKAQKSTYSDPNMANKQILSTESGITLAR